MGAGPSSATACVLRQRRGRWFLCVDDDQKAQFERASSSVGAARIEELMRELFRLHDLNKNGTLEEAELIKINEKIQVLHFGEGVDLEEVRRKYKEHFREKLNAEGQPVAYDTFRAYWRLVLQEHDKDPRVHEMILEQCIAEAESARQAFFIKAFHSESDAPYLPTISYHGMLPPTAVSSLNRPGQAAGSMGNAICESFQSEVCRKPVAATLDSNCRPAEAVASTPGSGLAEGPWPSGGGGLVPGSCRSSGSDFVPRPSAAGRQDLPSLYNSLTSDFVPSPVLARPLGPGGTGASLPPGAAGLMTCASFESDFVPSPANREAGLDSTWPVDAPDPTTTWPLPGSQEPAMQFAAPAASSDRFRCTLPPGSAAAGPPSESGPRPAGLGLAVGEKVEVWSNSKGAWLDAVVQEAYSMDSFADGFSIPAGSVKVSSDAGVKWILPDQLGSTLRIPRAAEAAARRFRKGAAVQVWSDSRQAWLDGRVEEAFAEASKAEGFTVPAGALKVSSAAGVKWVMPEQVARTVREAGADAANVACSRLPAGAPSDAVDPGFAKGEKVQVWSDSRQLWLGGVVQEAFASSGFADGFSVPAGSLKVSSDAGVKWISQTLAAKVLRKVDRTGGTLPTPDLKAVLEEVLRDPARLQRHVDAVWAVAGCGAAGLPRSRVAWALEGLAMQFNVMLELEGRHLQLVEARCGGRSEHEGNLTQAEFSELSREMVAEVWSSL